VQVVGYCHGNGGLAHAALSREEQDSHLRLA
jgi:hypothetical protein